MPLSFFGIDMSLIKRQEELRVEASEGCESDVLGIAKGYAMLISELAYGKSTAWAEAHGAASKAQGKRV